MFGAVGTQSAEFSMALSFVRDIGASELGLIRDRADRLGREHHDHLRVALASQRIAKLEAARLPIAITQHA